ncbi:MFS transporter [Streptosporangiaceae bacterium NEAU-GS5]|nr:MFS transporter [Streptosporangiaceae bacterium NEAU-GS5]
MEVTVAVSARARQARVATWAAFGVQGLCFATLITHVVDLQHKFKLSDGDLTLVLLLVPVIAGVGSGVAGVLAARYGSSVVLRVSQAVVCALVILIAFNAGLAGLYVLSAVFGLFLGAVDATMNMQAVAVERTYGMSVLTGFHAVWSVGSMLGAAFNSVFAWAGLDLAWSLTIPMLLGAAISVVLLPRLYPRDDERATARALQVPAGRIPWGPIIPLCLAMAFLYVGDASVSNYSTVFMEQALDASGWLVPFAYVIYQAAMLVARVPGDFAVRRYGPAPVVRVGAFIAAAGTVLVIVSPGVLSALIGFALIGLGLSIVAPQSFSAAGRLGAGAETAIARVNMFNYVGYLVGALIVGVANDAIDIRTAFIAPAVIVALIALLARGFQMRTAGPTDTGAAPASPAHTEP